MSVGATSFTLSNGQVADSLGHVIHVISNDRSQEIEVAEKQWLYYLCMGEK